MRLAVQVWRQCTVAGYSSITSLVNPWPTLGTKLNGPLWVGNEIGDELRRRLNLHTAAQGRS